MNGHLFFQNTLLVIIASLLLILVIQNSQSRSPTWESATVESNSTYSPSNGSMMPPHALEPAKKSEAQVMKGSMVFQALKAFPKGCDGKKILAECSSTDAEAVKNEILKMEEKGMGPRQIFDAIVAQWGEKVLTDQALQIRQMRTKGQAR